MLARWQGGDERTRLLLSCIEQSNHLASSSRSHREVFEAGLIIGIVMAVTTGVAGHGRWVAGGVAAGVLRYNCYRLRKGSSLRCVWVD